MAKSQVSSAAKVMAGCLAGALLMVVLAAPSASGQQGAETRNEYSVTTIDANTLGAKVSEMALEGWDVVAITVVESRVDGANQPPKVITEKYDVTFRRAVRK